MLPILLLDFIVEIINAFNMIINLQLFSRKHKFERGALSVGQAILVIRHVRPASRNIYSAQRGAPRNGYFLLGSIM